jgi:hypothetical protein
MIFVCNVRGRPSRVNGYGGGDCDSSTDSIFLKSMKDLGKAFSFLFKDPNWVRKSLIAALWMILCLVGIGFFVLAGYLVQVTQRAMRGEEPALPAWNDIGVKLALGFKLFVVFLIYIVPIVVLAFPAITLGIAGELTDNPDLFGVIAAVYMFGFALFVIPYAIALSLLTPTICYRFAASEKIRDAIDVVRNVSLFTRNWQNSLIVALISAGLQSFAGIGVLFFFVGMFFTVFYAYLVSAYLTGLLGREQTEREAVTQ